MAFIMYKMGKIPSKCENHSQKKIIIRNGNKNRGRWDFPGGAVVKKPPANAGDPGSSPGPEGSLVPWCP